MIFNTKNCPEGKANKLMAIGILKVIKGIMIDVEDPITHEIKMVGNGKVIYDIKDKKGAWGVIRIRTNSDKEVG